MWEAPSSVPLRLPSPAPREALATNPVLEGLTSKGTDCPHCISLGYLELLALPAWL